MKSSLSNTTATRLRGIISSQILKKTLRLRSHKAADAAALTHISADVDGVLDVVRTVHDLWIGIIELAIGLYLLWTIVGMAFFAPLIPIIGEYYLKLYFQDQEKANPSCSFYHHWMVRW